MARIVEVAVADLTTRLHTPFVTALRRTGALDSVVVRLTDSDGRTGYGEAPQVWRVTGESTAGITACMLGPLADVLLHLTTDTPLAEVGNSLEATVVNNRGAKAACEVAVADLQARSRGESLHLALASDASLRLASAGAPVPDEVTTDVTVAADQSAGAVADRVRDGFRHLKVKVGIDAEDVDRVCRMYDAAPVPVRVRVDANQGWDRPTTLRAVYTWTRAGIPVEFVEQPLARWDLHGHASLRTELAERYAVPLMLDESVFDRHDLDRVIELGAADLVNIKLAKCGGLTAGLRLAATARAAGLGVMVGSMMESAVGACAAAALAALVSPETVHDLDSAWWTADGGPDRYRGNQFLLPAGPGLSQVTDELADVSWTVRSGRTPRPGPGPAH